MSVIFDEKRNILYRFVVSVYYHKYFIAKDKGKKRDDRGEKKCKRRDKRERREERGKR